MHCRLVCSYMLASNSTTKPSWRVARKINRMAGFSTTNGRCKFVWDKLMTLTAASMMINNVPTIYPAVGSYEVEDVTLIYQESLSRYSGANLRTRMVGQE